MWRICKLCPLQIWLNFLFAGSFAFLLFFSPFPHCPYSPAAWGLHWAVGDPTHCFPVSSVPFVTWLVEGRDSWRYKRLKWSSVSFHLPSSGIWCGWGESQRGGYQRCGAYFSQRRPSKRLVQGTLPLVVQRLRLWAPTAESPGLIPGQRTKGLECFN